MYTHMGQYYVPYAYGAEQATIRKDLKINDTVNDINILIVGLKFESGYMLSNMPWI